MNILINDDKIKRPTIFNTTSTSTDVIESLKGYVGDKERLNVVLMDGADIPDVTELEPVFSLVVNAVGFDSPSKIIHLGGDICASKITPDLLCIFHQLDRNLKGMPVNGRVKFVNGRTLKKHSLPFSLINLDPDDRELKQISNSGLRRRIMEVASYTLPPEIRLSFIAEDLHMAGELSRCYLGDKYTVINRNFVNFTPELGVEVTINKANEGYKPSLYVDCLSANIEVSGEIYSILHSGHMNLPDDRGIAKFMDEIEDVIYDHWFPND